MPANQRVRLDDHQQLTPVDQSRQRDQCDASRVGCAAWLHLPLEIQRQLLSQEQVLRRQLRAGVQRQASEACTIGEHIDDGAEGDAKTESTHGSGAYTISVATSSARDHSRESFAPHQREFTPDDVFADDNSLCVRRRTQETRIARLTTRDGQNRVRKSGLVSSPWHPNDENSRGKLQDRKSVV